MKGLVRWVWVGVVLGVLAVLGYAQLQGGGGSRGLGDVYKRQAARGWGQPALSRDLGSRLAADHPR